MTNTNLLTAAAALGDAALLARLRSLAVREREATAELVAHLAALDARPSVYAGEGYSSLFKYCTEALGLSEDAAYNRIETARACRRFPIVLEWLASGRVTLTAVRMVSRHLTAENHRAVLAEVAGKTKRQVEETVARLAPRADVVPSVRKLPASSPPAVDVTLPRPSEAVGAVAVVAAVAPPPPASRSVVQPTAPERYRVQCTVDRETHDRLRRLQDLLRREIPTGDVGLLFAEALIALEAKVEKAKLAKVDRPRPTRSGTSSIDDVGEGSGPSRHIPAEVKRAVWQRDGGCCAFVARSGRRCGERSFLEWHHALSHARGGPATVDNISLRCRRHNVYEAELESGLWHCRQPPVNPRGTAETTGA
jgi:hypothetical protein